MFTQYSRDVATAMSGVSDAQVQKVTQLLLRARFQNASVYILGNGGSSATASHFANDLTKTGRLRAMALSDLSPTLLAYGNDDGWEWMYSGILRTMLLPQDVVIGISCGGNSANVVNGLKMAKSIQYPAIKTIALTGDNLASRILTEVSLDAWVTVPFRDIRVQEDVHLAICHYVAGEVGNGTPKDFSRLLSTVA